MRGQIRKRGQSWCVVLYLGRRPQNGKKVYKWTTYPTRRDAEAALPKLIARIGAGTTLPSPRLTVGMFIDQWLHDYVDGLPSPVTRRNYRDVVRVHLLPALGHMPLARLSPQAVQMYVSQKLAQGQSATSVHCHFAILREALGHAVRWGLLAWNPTDSVDPPRRRQRSMHVWDEEQVRLFLAEARRSSEHYCLYLTAILTGMRQGELLGLRWSDIDFLLGTASIQQTMYRLKSTILFKEPKTARGRRSVALPVALIIALREHRDRQAEMRRVLGNEYEDHDLVFCQPNGKPLHAHNIVRRDFRRVTTRTGLPRIRFHDLRHTHATHLLRAGVHPKVVQERLGHSTPAFTLAVYSHVLPGMQEEAAKAVSSRLLGQPDPGSSESGDAAPSSAATDDPNGEPSARNSK
jgi:integrase